MKEGEPNKEVRRWRSLWQVWVGTLCVRYVHGASAKFAHGHRAVPQLVCHDALQVHCIAFLLCRSFWLLLDTPSPRLCKHGEARQVQGVSKHHSIHQDHRNGKGSRSQRRQGEGVHGVAEGTLEPPKIRRVRVCRGLAGQDRISSACAVYRV